MPLIDDLEKVLSGEQTIEVETSFENESLIKFAIIMIVTWVIIFGIAKVIQPFKK